MVSLKRKADDEEEAAAKDKKKRVEELMRLAGEGQPGASGAGGASGNAPAPSTSTGRAMQGQSAESGMHSIDSDEEEEYERSKKVERMAEEDYEGAEDVVPAVEREGEVRITPFNLKEEEEEGHFAKDGTFMWDKKKEEEASDRWLEDVDWGKVKERSEAERERREREDEAEEEAEAKYDEGEAYRGILALIRPGESVARAIRRLGGGKKTTAQKLKEKKRIREGKETEEEKSNREAMERLSGLADAVLSRSGHMEIYEETHESIAYKIKKEEEENKKKTTEIPEGVDEDDALDMFMETAKESEKDEEPKPGTSSSSSKAAAPALSLDDEVRWEFRWENEDGAEVHGPHTSQEMLDWQESGFFDKGVFVRKAGEEEFKDGKRIDFDLYT